jgi:hypothetical protein
MVKKGGIRIIPSLGDSLGVEKHNVKHNRKNEYKRVLNGDHVLEV